MTFGYNRLSPSHIRMSPEREQYLQKAKEERNDRKIRVSLSKKRHTTSIETINAISN